MFTDVYDIQYADYWLASNERLEDRAANYRLAQSAVYFIFLIRKSHRVSRLDPIIIPNTFGALQTSVYSKPCKYNELEYRTIWSCDGILP